MASMFDLLSLALFVGAAGVILIRVRRERTQLGPFAVVVVVAAVGNRLGEAGGGPAAACLLLGGAFLLLHLASVPYPEDGERAGRD